MGNSFRSVFPNTREWEQHMKWDKETDEEGKKRGVSMERSNAGTKKQTFRQPITTWSKYNNKKHNILFYKIWKKYNEIQLTNNKMDLNNWKMKNHSPSPEAKVKLYGQEPPDENRLPRFVWSIINTTNNAAAAAQRATPSYSPPQPVMDNGVRDERSNWLAVTSPPF